MRISHSGNGMLLKDPSAPFPLPNEQDSIPADEVASPDGDRIAIFAHLGANDSHATRYGDYLKTRKYMVDAWRKRPYDAEALEEARRVGLTVRDLPAEVMNDPSAGQDETWQPFPYAKQGAPAAAGQVDAAAQTPHGALVVARRYARAAARRARGTLRGAYRGFKESGPRRS